MRYIEKKRKSIDERRKSGKEERRENIKWNNERNKREWLDSKQDRREENGIRERTNGKHTVRNHKSTSSSSNTGDNKGQKEVIRSSNRYGYETWWYFESVSSIWFGMTYELTSLT
jgi:hypothetical protein